MDPASQAATGCVACALLDARGTILSVDREWAETDSVAAPFGTGWSVGENYLSRCENWPGLEAPDLVEALRAVVNGLRQRVEVSYEYSDRIDARSGEMRLQIMEVRGQRMIHMLHLEKAPVAKAPAIGGHSDAARQQTAEMMRLRAATLANLGQEIRTPLNEVLGMTGLVLDSHLNEDQRNCLSRSRDSARSLLALINNILDYSNAESGQMTLAEDPFDLRATLSRLVDAYAAIAAEKGLVLSCEFDSGIPRDLVGDAKRVGGLMRNLIDNAIKFTERGEVTVRAILHGENKDGIQVRFEVVDSGVGIDPSHHEKIFEPFVQQDGSSTRRHGGTGLGLSIVKCTATLMGGSVEIDSQPGNGSKFSVLLPFAMAQGVSHSCDETRSLKTLLDGSAATRENAQAEEGLRILVAEDNPVSQRLILSALVNRGHRPHLVEDGRAAVDAAVRERFDLVLMDLTLPVLDGFSSAAVIRQKERQGNFRVPIVGMTDPPAVPDDLRFRAAGLDAGLAKPIDGDALAALLAKLQAAARSRGLAHRFASRESPLVEIQQLLEETGGDIEKLARLSELFVESRAQLLKPIEAAIAQHNSQALAESAKDLTRTLRSMAAPRARHAAHKLELIGRDGRLAEAPPALTALQHEVEQLAGELKSIADEAAPSAGRS